MSNSVSGLRVFPFYYVHMGRKPTVLCKKQGNIEGNIMRIWTVAKHLTQRHMISCVYYAIYGYQYMLMT